MCNWTDCPGCEYFIERECHTGPHSKLERDLQQEVVGTGRTTSTAHARSHAPLHSTDTVIIQCVSVTVRAERALPSNQVVNALPPL